MQKYFGMGNILRAMGIPYPTTTPTNTSNELPIVKIPHEYHGKMHLFILAGQSNMIGWAPVPEEQEINPRIYVFGNDYRWRFASEPIDDAYNQVDLVSLDRVAFFGPSMAFATARSISR